MKRMRATSRRGGFTLLELTISTLILATVGYSVSVAVKLGKDSNTTVMQVASESRTERKTMASLIDDVRMSSDARVTVATDQAGNSVVQIQRPIEVEGAFVWGVRDRRLGNDEDSWNQENWTIRYLVDADGQLVRRVVDTNGVTRVEDVLGGDMLDGGVGNPAFSVARSGDVWEVDIATQSGPDAPISRSELHVRTRN